MTNLFAAIFMLFFFACVPKKNTYQKLSQMPTTDSLQVKPVKTHTTLKDSTEENPKEELHDSDYGIFHMDILTGNIFPKFYLKIFSQENKIEIYKDKTQKQLTQTIEVGEDVDLSNLYFNQGLDKGIFTEDYDFDGYKDLLVIRINGMHSAWYDIYLFDPKNSVFTKNNALSQLESPSVGRSKKEVSFYEYGGMAGGSYRKGIFKWNGNRLQLTREEKQEQLETGEAERFLRTVNVIKNTKLELASKVMIFFDSKNGSEIHCLLEGRWEEFEKETNLLFVDSVSKVQKRISNNGNCN